MALPMSSCPPSSAAASRGHFDFRTDAGEYKKKTSAIPFLTAAFHDSRSGGTSGPPTTSGTSDSASTTASSPAVLYRVGMKAYGRLTATPGGHRQALTVVPIERVWMERIEPKKDTSAPPQQQPGTSEEKLEGEGEAEVKVAADGDLSTEDDEPSLESKEERRLSSSSRGRTRPRSMDSKWPEGYDPKQVIVRPEQIQLLLKGEETEAELKEGQPGGGGGAGTGGERRPASGSCDFLVCLETSQVQSTLVRPPEWAQNRRSSFIVLREPGVYRLSYPSYYSLLSLQWSLINSFTSTLSAYAPPPPREKATAHVSQATARRLKREAERKEKVDNSLEPPAQPTGRPLRATIRAKQEETKRMEEEAKRLKEERRIARGRKKRKRSLGSEDEESLSLREPPTSPALPSSSRRPPPPLLLSSAPKRKSSVLPHHCYGYDWRVVCRVVECVYAQLHSTRSSSIRWAQVAELMQPAVAITPTECRRLWRLAAYQLDETGHSNLKRLDLKVQHSRHRREDDDSDGEPSDIDVDLPAGVVYVGHDSLLAAARAKPRVEERLSAHGWSTECDHALIHVLLLWADKKRTAEAAMRSPSSSSSSSSSSAAVPLTAAPLPTPPSSLQLPPSAPPSSSPLSLRYLPSIPSEWDVVSALFHHFAGVEKSGAFLFNRFALLARTALTTDVGEQGRKISNHHRVARERLLQTLHCTEAPVREAALHSGGKNWETSRRIDDRRARRRKRERRESSKRPHPHHSAAEAEKHKREELEAVSREVGGDEQKGAQDSSTGAEAMAATTGDEQKGSGGLSDVGMDGQTGEVGEEQRTLVEGHGSSPHLRESDPTARSLPSSGDSGVEHSTSPPSLLDAQLLLPRTNGEGSSAT